MHLTAVGFVIHTQQMEEAVQHQDADFVFKRVAECRRLSPCSGGGYGDVAQVRGRWRGREGEDVGGVVIAQKFAIKAAEMAVAGDETGERAALSDSVAQSSGEAFQAAPVQFRRGPAEQNYMVV